MEQDLSQTHQSDSDDEEVSLNPNIPIRNDENSDERGVKTLREERCPNLPCRGVKLTLNVTTKEGLHVMECPSCKNIFCPHCKEPLSKDPAKRQHIQKCPKCDKPIK